MSRSVCVVALMRGWGLGVGGERWVRRGRGAEERRRGLPHASPKGVADDEEGDVLVLGRLQDGLGFRLDRLPVGELDLLAVRGFLRVARGRGRRGEG
jgi:hypothetical protein